MKINIHGDVFNQTGYAIHTRQLANALNKYHDVSMLCDKPAGWEKVVDDKELDMIMKQHDNADVGIMIGLPQYWPLMWSNTKSFIGFLVWEGDKIPEYWIDILMNDKCSQIWVASEHTKKAIEQTMVDWTITNPKEVMPALMDKIKIIPHGVDPSIFYPTDTPEERPFTFIANKGWRGNMLDRGGLQFLFKAYYEEFTKDDDVELLVKINSVYQQIDLQKSLYALGLMESRAPIKIISDNLDYKALNEIYNKGDVFVSPSMAEAFNLPCLEAMACGLPVITTDFGGQTDFVNDENGWLLKEGKMFEVDWDVAYEGVQWKRPSIEELRKTLREVYELGKQGIDEKSKKALETSKYWIWDNSAIQANIHLELLK